MSEEKTPPPPPPPPTTTTPGTPRLRVRIPKEYSSSSSSSSNSSSSFASLVKQWSPLPTIKQNLAWIPANWTWSKIKAALRCAVCAWVSGVVFVIPAVEVFLGNASFLLLIASVLSPPSDPFISVLERELLILLFVAVAWAWSCLGIKFADLARDFHDPTVNIRDAATGQFVEGGPSVILAVFLFLGSAFFLYIKARMGPGPYLFASIFACICLDIALTTAALFPFPFYLLGRTIILPLTIHTAISLLCSLLIFPSTMSTEYTGRLQNILLPIQNALSGHIAFFAERPSITSEEFTAAKSKIADATIKSEAGLVPLAASSRLLSNDLVYGRFSPSDFRVFHALVRRLTGRAAGMKGYFDLVELSRERLMLGTPLQTPALSRVATPALSRRPSVDGEREGRGRGVKMDHRTDSLQSHRSGTGHISPTSPTSPSSPRSRSHSRHRHVIPKHHHHVLHHSLLHLTLSRHGHGGHGSGGGGHGGYGGEGAVGTFESQRYMDLESVKFGERGAGGYIERSMTHLSTSSTPLLQSLTTATKTIHTWLGNVGGSRGVRWWDFVNHHSKQSDSIVEDVRRAHAELTSVLEKFRNDTRHEVLTPYTPLFDPNPAPAEGVDVPPHHYLFHCYVYQYHLMQFAGVVGEMLEALLTLEETRQKPRLWTPIRKLFKWNKYDVPENIENDDDEDPDVIQGLHPPSSDRADNDNESLDLGIPTQRDPDALPPRNAFEWVMTLLYHAASSFTHGNTLFAMKAGVFTVLLALPFFIRHSAEFAYKNRVVWAIIMGQLTIARFRGDTAFGLMARIISTFMGGVVGMVMWYISTGKGHGSPYGLAAVFLVCFPFFFYARLYWAVHPMINLIFFVTASLVVGYSYMDEHVLTPGSPGVGFSVAWKRFVLVTVGVFCAFIISFLPPSTTLRKYQRNLLATSSLELGAIYCSIISFANSPKEHEIQDIVTSLIAVRSKLKRSLVMKANVVYEFSLRGRWPAQRYQQVLDLQLQLSYSLSNLMSIMEHLEPTWTRAFLRRTRFMDPDFQGDVLAVFTMISSSLRTGEPLPQVTPSPLVHRFLARAHGLEVIHRESEEDYGLPRTLTLETLKNEQYLMFCVGVSVAFGIVNRLDKLMVATKEIVGEQYHIHGLGVRNTLDLGPRASASAAMGQFRPPRDV